MILCAQLHYDMPMWGSVLVIITGTQDDPYCHVTSSVACLLLGKEAISIVLQGRTEGGPRKPVK